MPTAGVSPKSAARPLVDSGYSEHPRGVWSHPFVCVLTIAVGVREIAELDGARFAPPRTPCPPIALSALTCETCASARLVYVFL